MKHRLLTAMSRRLAVCTALVALSVPSPSHAQSVWTGRAENNFVVTTADVAAAAAFYRNNGADNRTIEDTRTVGNSGNFKSKKSGRITGQTNAASGMVTNYFVVTDADVAAASAFTNNAGGTVTDHTVASGGRAANNFVVTDVDVAESAAFVNNSRSSTLAVRNAVTTSNSGTVANTATFENVEVRRQGRLINSGAMAGAITNSGVAVVDRTVSSLYANFSLGF